MSKNYLDFVGFTFGDKHSSELGILRVSEGDRYNVSVLPTISNKTIQVPGGDGSYYFGSTYTQRQFSISIAFDSLTEELFSEMVRWLSTKDIKDLIFDETPYKKYKAKVASSPRLAYICFEEEGKRVYKGEGTIEFVCYYPFARSVHKYREEYTGAAADNLAEWIDASRIRYRGNYDVWDNTGVVHNLRLYNAGDMETDYCLTIPFTNDKIITFDIFVDLKRIMRFKEISKIGEDTHIRINTRNNLIEGLRAGAPSGNLYNQYLESGTFSKIPVGESALLINKNLGELSIEYDYLYF